MKKALITFFVLFSLTNLLYSENVLLLRMSGFGAPGIQFENRSQNLGLGIGIGFDPLVWGGENIDQEIISYFPFDISINYYVFNTEDDLLLFLNLGSVFIPRIFDENDEIEYLESYFAIMAGVGLSTEMWGKIKINIKLGVGWLLGAYRTYGTDTIGLDQAGGLSPALEISIGYIFRKR